MLSKILAQSVLDGELWIKDMTGHEPQVSVLELVCAVFGRLLGEVATA